jgi:hypothetical protein
MALPPPTFLSLKKTHRHIDEETHLKDRSSISIEQDGEATCTLQIDNRKCSFGTTTIDNLTRAQLAAISNTIAAHLNHFP